MTFERGPYLTAAFLCEKVLDEKDRASTMAPSQMEPFSFEGEDDRGIDIVARMSVEVTVPGVYWFRIELDDQLVTKIPWRVIYSPQTVTLVG